MQIQLWPNGTLVEVEGEAEGLKVKYASDPELRPATKEERRSVEVNRYAEHIASTDVLHCDSSLVDDMLKAAGNNRLPKELASEWDYDNIANQYTAADSMTYDECVDWLEERGLEPDAKPYVAVTYLTIEEEEEQTTYLPFGSKLDWGDEGAVKAAVVEETGDEVVTVGRVDVASLVTEDGAEWDEDDATSTLQDQIRDNAEAQEIYEWWRVTKWLAKRLEEIGEPVLSNAYGQWWGRTCTGQSMLQDGTLQRVADSVIRS
jgi:hypothetical protein